MDSSTSKNRLEENKSRWVYWTVTGGILIVLIALYFIWPDYRNFFQEAWQVLSSGETEKIENWVGQFGMWGPLLIVVLMILQMFLLVVPSWMLMVIAVLAYGPIAGCLIAIVAVAVAATIGYGIGLLVGSQGLNRLLGKSKQEAVEREVEAYGIWAVVIARINPLLSNDGISLLGGMLRLGFLKFILATIAGITPLAVAIAIFGQEWKSMKTGLIVISVVSLIGLGIKIWTDKRKSV